MAFEQSDINTNEEEANWRLVTSPVGGRRSGRERYAAAMYFYSTGRIDAETLEIYRICAKLDNEDPIALMNGQGIGADWVELLDGAR